MASPRCVAGVGMLLMLKDPAVIPQLTPLYQIGSSIAVQVCLIQMPLLIFLCEISGTSDATKFTLVFDDVYVWAVLLSTFVMNYVFMDGKCDYFQGSALIIVYLIMISMIYFSPASIEIDGGL